MSLFDTDEQNAFAPLAERLRPQRLSEVVGQQHLVGSGKPLQVMVSRQHLASMIFWGPPGTGKTTLARVLSEEMNAEFIALSAVLAGVKEVREAVAQASYSAQQGRQTILFVDEVHRFNKAQQDAFLPHVEDGTVTFVGATTENPSFEVNQALLSRARVFVLNALSSEDLGLLADRAFVELGCDAEEDARAALISAADGDGRRLLNIVELAVQFAPDGLTAAAVADAMGESVRRFDKGGDAFYEQISALHKAVRGSSPDGALYWFCRMLDGGADPRYIGRRLVRMATEDVGNADPRALQLAMAALQSYERLGSPEGELGLAQTVLYLASVPKSDAVYKAFSQAMTFVRETGSQEVPMHLRNAPTRMMKDMGYGADYRHAHNETTDAGAYAAGVSYFPETLPEVSFYSPVEQGLEKQIKQRLQQLRALDEQRRGEDTKSRGEDTKSRGEHTKSRGEDMKSRGEHNQE